MLDTSELSALIISTLDAAKAVDIKKIDVRKMTDITDFMIICHGTSDRHVTAMARHVTDTLAAKACKPVSIEVEDTGEWILIDYLDAVVHIMQREAREHYDLESLWNPRLSTPEDRQKARSA